MENFEKNTKLSHDVPSVYTLFNMTITDYSLTIDLIMHFFLGVIIRHHKPSFIRGHSLALNAVLVLVETWKNIDFQKGNSHV